MVVNENMYQLGSVRSAIRELFEYGKKRAEIVGPENVYDFSLGNPSIPAPECVNETIRELTENLDSISLHGYTSAQGDLETRQAVADYLNSQHGTGFNADNFYITMGAAASLSLCFSDTSDTLPQCLHSFCCIFAALFPPDQFPEPQKFRSASGMPAAVFHPPRYLLLPYPRKYTGQSFWIPAAPLEDWLYRDSVILPPSVFPCQRLPGYIPDFDNALSFFPEPILFPLFALEPIQGQKIFLSSPVPD